MVIPREDLAHAGTITTSVTLLEAIRQALLEEMERDPRVLLLGEDIGQLGGVFRATDGLMARFGEERVIDTPMMELGIAGLAVGMAMNGLRPVAEIQFADFVHAAADHLVSDAARIRFRTNGDWQCPMVLRTAYGGGFRGGPYHSQSVEAFYTHVPGLKVVAPSFPDDAKGLLLASIRDPDPVLFLEHKRLYRAIRGEVPEGDHTVPFGRARLARGGQHVTVVAWGWVLHESLAAAEELAREGIEVEVIDPRSLVPFDEAALFASLRKTGRLCVVHEDTRTMGFGAEIAALAAETCLDDLRAPVRRITMPDVAGIPASGPMEDFLIPDRARIAEALRALASIDRGVKGQMPGWDGANNGHVEAGLAPGTDLAGPREAGDWASVMTASATTIPQAASVVEVDLSRVAEARESLRAGWEGRGVQPSYTPFFLRALVQAVAEAPQVNAAFDAEGRTIREYAALGIGLSVAGRDGESYARHGVVQDADTRNLLGLAIEADEIASGGALDPSVLSEATITLADFGPGSALFAVPLVLPGQVAAVRVGAVEERLLARGRGFALVPTAYLSASIDHRVLDGVDAGALLRAMQRVLENWPLNGAGA